MTILWQSPGAQTVDVFSNFYMRMLYGSSRRVDCLDSYLNRSSLNWGGALALCLQPTGWQHYQTVAGSGQASSVIS
jgi:hypothetical protein